MNNTAQEASYNKTAFCVCSKFSPLAGDIGRKNPWHSRGARHTGCPGLPYSGVSRPSRDWGHVCPMVSQSLPQLPHCLFLRGQLLICALPIQTFPKSQDIIICLVLCCIKLSICGDSKTKFLSKDITGPVGLASFPCPFAYPSGALSDTGPQPRCPL